MISKRIHEALGKNTETELSGKEGIDISKINIEALRRQYRDLRLTPIPVTFDYLSFPYIIKEAYGDILAPDAVITKIMQKYKLDKQFVSKLESYNKIAIYIVIAQIGDNVELIKADMEKMGYFLSVMLDSVNIQGMGFVELKFEPFSYMQSDETDAIKAKYDILYHWTPEYNLPAICANGLIPSHKNKLFNYPPRTYLIKGDCDDNEMISLGQKLCVINKTPENNGVYVLLAVDIKNIGDGIKFYYGPNSEMGIYTEQDIPCDNIHQVTRQRFPITLKIKS